MDVTQAARAHTSTPLSTDQTFWRETLTAQPEVMYRLLGDLWRASQAARGADARIAAPTVDELFGLVIPEYSNQPFHLALQAKLGERSIRWLAEKVHHSKSHVHRWLTGARPIINLADPYGSMAQIEAVADAVGVHPAYFAEWRRLWTLLLIDDAFTRHPNLSIGVWKKFAGLTQPATNGRSQP